MCSEYAIRNSDYKTRTEFKEFEEKCEVVYTGYTNYGLALNANSIKLSVPKVIVKIRPMTFEESGAKYDQKKSKYIYEMQDGVFGKFDKNELEMHIYVSLAVAIKIDEKNVGYILSKEI